MIEQSVNPQASIAGLKGLGGKGGKAVQAGLFAKLMAAFQAQLKTASTGKDISVSIGDGGKALQTHSKLSKVESALSGKEQAMLALLQGGEEHAEGKAKALSAMEELLTSRNGEALKKVQEDSELKELLLAMMNGEEGSKDTNETDSALAGLITAQSTESQKAPVHKLFETSAESDAQRVNQGLLTGQGKTGSANAGSVSSMNAGQAKINLEYKTKVGSDLSGRKQSSEQLLRVVHKNTSQGAQKSDVLLEENPLNGKSATPGTATKPVSGEHHSVLTSKVSSRALSDAEVANSEGSKAGVARTAIPKTRSDSAVTASKITVGSKADDDHVAQSSDRARASVVESALQKGNEKRVAQRSEPVQAEQPEAQVSAPANTKVKVTTQANAMAGQAQYAGGERVVVQSGETGGGNLQQERGGHLSELLINDAAKVDAKGGRSGDFALQMSHKSHALFKPAEVMMEVARSAKDGALKIELQLEPAHLGRVQVSLQSDAAKQVQVHFTVDQAASRQALEAQMPQLRLALAQQGLDLSQFSMNMSSQDGQDGTGNSSEAPFSQFANAEPGSDVEHDSMLRMGVNSASHGHLSILA